MLAAADYAVLLSYLALVLWIGFRAGRHQQTTEDYFLGGRSIPWWAAGLSIIATETSALTFIGAPTQSLRGDWTYLQLAFGSVLGRLLVAGLLIGAYYRARVFTVYEYLEGRFGVLSKNAASALFFIGRSLGSGVRLYGAAIALVVVADMPFPLAIAAIASVAVLYTIVGGIRSVIWTDMVQGILLVGGAVAALVFLIRDTGLSIGDMTAQLEAARTAAGESKLRVLDFSLDPKLAYTLMAGIIGSAFLTLSTHGTDQDMIQRALTCRGSQGGRQSLWLSAALNIPIVVLFLAIGSALWLRLGGDEGAARTAAEIAARAGETDPAKGFDYIFPFYVVQTLPVGVKGLIIAAIFAAAMSSLDSAIAALSSTAVKCVWEPYVQPGREDRHYLRVSRWMAVLFGIILVAVAVVVWLGTASGGHEEGFGILMLGLKVLTWVFPPLLGVFLLGVLTMRGSDVGNLIALTVGIGTLLVVEFSPQLFGSPAPFAWSWNSLIGCVTTFSIAALFDGSRARALEVRNA